MTATESNRIPRSSIIFNAGLVAELERNMMRSRHSFLYLAMLPLLYTGCSSKPAFEEEPVKANLRQISKAHGSIVAFHRRPPKDIAELSTALDDLHRLEMGAPAAEALVSPRDQQPFEIILDAGTSEPGDAILAFEKQGAQDGRWAVNMQGDIVLLKQDEFSQAKFARGRKPPSAG
jgi:hypothetical protein